MLKTCLQTIITIKIFRVGKKQLNIHIRKFNKPFRRQIFKLFLIIYLYNDNAHRYIKTVLENESEILQIDMFI